MKYKQSTKPYLFLLFLLIVALPMYEVYLKHSRETTIIQEIEYQPQLANQIEQINNNEND